MQVVQFGSAEEEAEVLAAAVERMLREEGVRASDVCALFRATKLKRTFPPAPLVGALRK